MRNKVRRRQAVLIRGATSSAGADVDFAKQLADLLSDSEMRAVQDSAAEGDGVVRLSVVGGDGGDLDVQLLGVADEDGVEVVVAVHDVKLRDLGDELVVEGQEDVAFLEGVACGLVALVGALGDEEKLVVRCVGEGDFLDPFFGYAHDTGLGHLDGAELAAQQAQLGVDTLLELGDDGEQGGRSQAKMVFLVPMAARVTLTKVCKPEGLDGAVLRNEHTTAALA